MRRNENYIFEVKWQCDFNLLGTSINCQEYQEYLRRVVRQVLSG